MADLAAADVTITLQTGVPWNPRIEGNKRKVLVSIAFGNGALTYPANGVPLPTYTSFGLVRNLEYLTLIDQDDASGILWKYDYANNKLRGYYRGAITPSGQVAAHTHSLYLPTPATADAAANDVNAALDGSDLYVSQPAGGSAPITVAGLAAGSTAHGGVVGLAAGNPAFTGSATAAAVLTELASGSYAPAAQTLYAEAVGW